jgi:tripartite-type tricarboxylate transporter receptor subunit TctC
MNTLMKGTVAALLMTVAAAAGAQAFPDRPVKVIIPYAPGGGTDNLIRTIAPTVSASMGHQLVIENRPGGNTFIGTEMVAKSTPDGYTVLATDSALVVNPGLFRAKVPFDTAKSFTGLTMMAYAPVLLVTHPSVPANTLPELLALARAKPGSMNYASGGSGTSTHLAAELMKLAAKVFIVHIPYKGTGPAMTDLLAGQVQMQFAGISSARTYVEAGRLKAMAVTGTQRNPAMPNVPTFEEFGLKGIDADSYWGVYAPSGTPATALATLNRHFVAALRSPAHAERLAALGYLPIANTPQEHTQQMQAMIARWTDVIDRLKISSE